MGTRSSKSGISGSADRRFFCRRIDCRLFAARDQQTDSQAAPLLQAFSKMAREADALTLMRTSQSPLLSPFLTVPPLSSPTRAPCASSKVLGRLATEWHEEQDTGVSVVRDRKSGTAAHSLGSCGGLADWASVLPSGYRRYSIFLLHIASGTLVCLLFFFFIFSYQKGET